MKTNAIVRIVLFSLGIFLLSSVLLVGLGVWNFGFLDEPREISHSGQFSELDVTSADPANTQISQNETISADPAEIHNIEIQWAAGNITIQPSDQINEIQIAESEAPEKDRMVCKVSGSTLTIQFCKTSQNFISFGTDIDAKDLVVTVPGDWVCKNLEIEVAAADVKIANMTIGELDFDGASGQCILENCTVGDLDVDAASGDLRFSGALDTLDFDGASADCTLVLVNCPSHIGLDGMSGELDITLPSDCGFIVSTEGLSTSFSTDFTTVARNGAHHYGDGACSIEIQALSGNVHIHDGGYTCHTSSQDCPDATECDTHSNHHSGHH